MKCEICFEKEATLEQTFEYKNIKSKVYLCSDCFIAMNDTIASRFRYTTYVDKPKVKVKVVKK